MLISASAYVHISVSLCSYQHQLTFISVLRAADKKKKRGCINQDAASSYLEFNNVIF